MGYNTRIYLKNEPKDILEIFKSMSVLINKNENNLHDLYECMFVNDENSKSKNLENRIVNSITTDTFPKPLKMYWFNNFLAELCKISKLIPDVKITLYCEGEINDDIYYIYCQNGQYQRCNLIKKFEDFDINKLKNYSIHDDIF